MPTFFEKIRKYYKRSQNRVVFSNGMSLNQLAQEMWEDLGYKGIDASVLSKVINGQRVFTESQIKSFCKILTVPQNEADLLLLFGSSSKKATSDSNGEGFITSEYLDLFDINIRTIPFLRSEGAMRQANDIASRSEIALKFHLETVHSEAAERVLLQSLSRVCLEQSRNISDVADYGEGYPKMLPIIKKLEFFAEKTLDPESHSRLFQSKGDAFYNLKKYKFAAKCFKEAASYTADLYWKLEGLRAYALCVAKLHEKKAFLSAVNEIEDLVQSGKVADTFFLITLYEALARGYALFAEDYSFSLLEKSEKIGEEEKKKGHIIILPKIQIIRSQLTALSLLPNTSNNSDIEKTARIGLALTSSYKYTRQEKEINTLLNQMIGE